MLLREKLTKENFWNQAMTDYPKATKLFCDWIDEYKTAIGWNKLFGDLFPSARLKFHDIPYEMQQGIWIAFAQETISHYFELPEYQYRFDMEEDIKKVFSQLEPLIETEN